MHIRWSSGIRYRLFLAFLASTCCVVVSMFIVTRFSFERGVFRYVNLVEKERLESLAQTIEQIYQDKKSWQFLSQYPSTWDELVASTRPHPFSIARYYQSLGNLVDGQGPRMRVDLPPPPPPKGEQVFEHRVLLLDAENKQLMGPKQPWALPPYFMPLKVEQQTIGSLGLIPPRILVDVRVRQFVQEQHRSLIIIALSIAAGAALLALPLAGKMVRRITHLATATTGLASGNYTIRVPENATDELGQLARDFNILASSLERNETLRRRWVADISHELRTPLAVLRGEVEAIQDGIRPLAPATMDGLHDEIVHLSRLVDDLYELSLADIGALSYHRQRLDLQALLHQTLGSLTEEFTARQLQLVYQGPKNPLLINGDGERIRQLLINLLCNALRYTDAGGQIQVTLLEHKEMVALRIADSAPGVPPEALAHVFERLYRVEGSRNKAHGGAGLGLALCRSIVETHGGSISAAPADLGGLEITVCLAK